MTRYAAEALYELLPAVYRTRDGERGYPLRDLIEILAGQAGELEANIAQLYANQFIETCEPWVVPYIGDLVGMRTLPAPGTDGRAEVANILAYRKAKGTAAVLEAIARDVMGHSARVVEYFDLLPTTQWMNHLRLHRPRTPDLRRANALDHVDRAFDVAAHTVDVRHVSTRRGRHNIPSVGLHVFRLEAFPLELIEPTAVGDPGDARYVFTTLGHDAPLFHNPVTETGLSHLAEEVHVDGPIRRRALHADLEQGAGDYYGPSRSVAILVPAVTGWERLQGVTVIAADLEPITRPLPPATVAIDPVRGRLGFADAADRPAVFRVTSYAGAPMAIGGGQYDRQSELSGAATAFVGDPADPLVQAVLLAHPAAASFDNVADALVDAQAAWNPGEARTIEILDSRTYRDAWPPVAVPADARLTVRAADRQRPTLRLPGDVTITGGAGSALSLNGLVVGDASVSLGGSLNTVSIAHCTFVPGHTLDIDGRPAAEGAVSLVVGAPTSEVRVRASILGAVQAADAATVSVDTCIVDAHRRDLQAFGGVNGAPFGGPLTVTRSTIVGRVDTAEMTLGENSIFLGTVTAERRQAGCVRFSWVPPDSRVPRRFHCQPVIPDAATAHEARVIVSRLAPRFTSRRFGHPAYCQLDWRGPAEITRGADDESEMGVYGGLKHAQREAALRVRLDEFLPVGLEAGILFAT